MRDCGNFLNERTVTAWRTAESLTAASPEPAPDTEEHGTSGSRGAVERPVQAGWKHTLEWLAGRVLAA
jgi:hypothetical protein